jgi:leader peptidase (prepilin peptidase)/N-methyltransferase
MELNQTFFLMLFPAFFVFAWFQERVLTISAIHADPEAFTDIPNLDKKSYFFLAISVFCLSFSQLYILKDTFIHNLYWISFFILLTSIFVTDFKYYLIPDTLSYPLIWLGILYSLSTNDINVVQNAVLGVIVGYLTLWGIYLIHFFITEKEGMGFGDFKLVAGFGAWFGLDKTFIVVFIGSVLALITFKIIQFIKKDDEMIPFGVPLVVGAIIFHFFPNIIRL